MIVFTLNNQSKQTFSFNLPEEKFDTILRTFQQAIRKVQKSHNQQPENNNNEQQASRTRDQEPNSLQKLNQNSIQSQSQSQPSQPQTKSQSQPQFQPPTKTPIQDQQGEEEERFGAPKRRSRRSQEEKLLPKIRNVRIPGFEQRGNITFYKVCCEVCGRSFSLYKFICRYLSPLTESKDRRKPVRSLSSVFRFRGVQHQADRMLSKHNASLFTSKDLEFVFLIFRFLSYSFRTN